MIYIKIKLAYHYFNARFTIKVFIKNLNKVFLRKICTKKTLYMIFRSTNVQLDLRTSSGSSIVLLTFTQVLISSHKFNRFIQERHKNIIWNVKKVQLKIILKISWDFNNFHIKKTHLLQKYKINKSYFFYNKIGHDIVLIYI